MTLALSEHLPLIASAPGGIQKLRWLILELAVRGKLLPQEPSDEPATKLLERIEQEQKVLAKAGAYKKTKSIPQPATEGQPFDLPKSWAWTNFANVTSYIQRGKGPSYADKSDYVVVSQKCVRWNGLDLSQARCITPESFSKYDAIRLLRCGDVLWNSTGTGTIGRAVIVPNLSEDQLLVADSHVTVVRPIIISPDYLWRWIQTPTVQNTIESMASGSTNQIELATSTVTAHPIPIPPLAEQHRIVAKVDELMALCDRLESEQNDSTAAHTVLVETLLGTLTQSTDAADFEANWKRIAEYFDILFTTEASIDTLQKTILQLAVMGKLVPQDPNEESADRLLKRIESEKMLLETEGVLKKSKQLPAVSEDEKTFIAPHGWAWCRLQHAFDVRDGTHDSPKFQTRGIPFLTSKNIYGGKLDLADLKFISESDHIEFSKRSKVDRNDILFAMIGSIGNPVVVNTDIDFSFKNMALFKYFSKELSSPEFLKIFLSVIATDMKAKAAGGVQSFVALGTIRNQPIALPPLPEQCRIVAKAEEFMAICDRLKNQIIDSKHHEIQLADTLIKIVLAAA